MSNPLLLKKYTKKTEAPVMEENIADNILRFDAFGTITEERLDEIKHPRDILTTGENKNVQILEPAGPAALHAPTYWDEKRDNSNERMRRKIRESQDRILLERQDFPDGLNEASAERIAAEQKKISDLMKQIEINKAKNARTYDKKEERAIKAEAAGRVADIYEELMEAIPKRRDKKEKRLKLYRAKEMALLNMHRWQKRNKIDEIENPRERAREIDTYNRHRWYDRARKLFYTPSELSVEGAVYRKGSRRLVNVGRAFMGGTKPMYYFEDRNDPVKDEKGNITGYKKYLYKEAVNCIGRKKIQGALVTEAASKLQKIVCGEYSIDAFTAKNSEGQIIGSFQVMIEQKDENECVNLFKWQAAPDDSLSDEMKEEILREHTLDWLLCNFDTKGENFLHRKEDGHLCSFDKEASFSYITDEEAQHMSYTYRPHNNDTLYNTIFNEYINGRIELNFERTLERAAELQNMGDEEYISIFDRMLRKKYSDRAKRNEVRQLILRRKNNLVDEYSIFISDLNSERNNHI